MILNLVLSRSFFVQINNYFIDITGIPSKVINGKRNSAELFIDYL